MPGPPRGLMKVHVDTTEQLLHQTSNDLALTRSYLPDPC